MIDVETLDDPRADPAVVRRTLRDIVKLNRLFGGTRAVLWGLRSIFERSGMGDAGCGMRWTLLDVGTGAGDIPRAAVALARRHGIELVPIGVERIPVAARATRSAGVASVLADGGALPFGPRSVDVVTVSQVLHHLPHAVAVAWIAALHRIARRAVVLADLRRSPLAIAGMWLAAFPLGLDATTRHDAVLSLKRGYTRGEFEGMLREAGIDAPAHYRPIARIVAAWEVR
jgi:SAM-dependent methyltransferase